MQQLGEGIWTWRVWKAGAFRGVSFNGHYLLAGDARLLVDPPPLNAWDEEHLDALGAPTRIVVTNANHFRAAAEARARWGAELLVPALDRGLLESDAITGTFSDGDELGGGVVAVSLHDQKTPGETALRWPERQLVLLGDALIGAPRGALCMLPAAKFKDPAAARAGLRRLLELAPEVLLVGDGESLLKGGADALRAFFREVPEVALERDEHGLLPAGPGGWFVLNLGEARWRAHPVFGTWCDLEGQRGRFAQLGLNVSVLEPGRPACLYHRETAQEGFLVLSGECLLLVEGQERRLRAWDYFHCPPGTAHVFVGAGDGPCAVLMVGARAPDMGLEYPVSALAERHGASAAETTDSPQAAYAPFGGPSAHTRAAWPLPG
ncbi:MAG: cupin domain-containing protein [Planctomycetota bacterium]